MRKTEINDRIAALISALGMNNNSFSVAIGVAAPVIYNIVDPEGRRSKPSFEVLEKILLSFDNINLEWLMLGKGENIFIAHPNAHPSAHLKGKKGQIPLHQSNLIEELRTKNIKLEAKIEALYQVIKDIGSDHSKKKKSA
jgi:hypothetical protein